MKKKDPKSKASAHFEKTQRAEADYGRQLRGIAREISRIISGYDATTSAGRAKLTEALGRYAELLEPWAKVKAGLMLARVNHEDAVSWRKATSEISAGLTAEVARAPTGYAMRRMLGENVDLIKSLPIDAAKRVHHFAQEALTTGTRSKEFVEEIMKSGKVARSRATMIARTETARAASTLTQARARYIGSDGYIWRTSRDGDVRPSHKKMEGKFVSWDAPPTLDGLTGHAGCLPNCRCYPEPLIPKNLE